MKTQKMFYHLILCILTDLVRQDKQTFISFAKIKIKAVIYYIKAIRFIRRICIGIFLLILSFVVMICGFIFLHVAFLYYFPLSKEVKALVIFSLGIFYFLTPSALRRNNEDIAYALLIGFIGHANSFIFGG